MNLLIKKLLLFILLFISTVASATAFSPPNITTNTRLTQVQKNVFYSNGAIYVKGFNGPGAIEVYSIIGNKITVERTQELKAFQFTFPLAANNMYIIRVVSNGKVTTFKVVAS